jgi:hypothetical protein
MGPWVTQRWKTRDTLVLAAAAVAISCSLEESVQGQSQKLKPQSIV